MQIYDITKTESAEAKFIVSYVACIDFKSLETNRSIVRSQVKQVLQNEEMDKRVGLYLVAVEHLRIAIMCIRLLQ